MRVAATDRGLCEVRFQAGPSETGPEGRKAAEHVRRACRQLREYFAGKRTRFDVPLDCSVGTPFQRAVWRACARIPYGEAWSYGRLARAAGHPRSARAVGNAMHANRIPVFIPCHRVIRSDGALGGFGSGVRLKAKLLRLERSQGRSRYSSASLAGGATVSRALFSGICRSK
jgi:methylated-DNA-[protein]-cysteine S-methyltransferase